MTGLAEQIRLLYGSNTPALPEHATVTLDVGDMRVLEGEARSLQEALDAALATVSSLRAFVATRNASSEDLEIDSVDELKAGDVVREPATPFSGVRIYRPRSRQ